MNRLLPFPPTPFWTRRRALQGLGSGVLGALLAGCALPARAPVRPLDRDLAPRVGESWRYQYTSAWRNVPSRILEARVLEVTGTDVRDRMAVEGEPGGNEQRFDSALAMVGRPVSGGLFVHEFSPYLAAFGGFPGPGSFAVSVPPPNWGTQWSASATLRGTERLTVPAGTFDAMRVDIVGSRPFIRGQMDDAIDPVWLYATAWYAPAAKRVVQHSRYTQAAGLNVLERDQYQLVSHRAP